MADEADFEELSAEQFHILFNDTNRHHRLPITVINDELFESLEEFVLELGVSPLVSPPLTLMLIPNATTVYIMDDDSMYSSSWDHNE